MQAVATEQSIPDLVETAWRTEGRIRDLEISVAPTMTDLRDARIRIDQIGAELHETKLKVIEIARQQSTVLVELGKHGLTVTHMKAEIGGMQAEIGGMKALLHRLVDHFGLTIPSDVEEQAETE